MSELKYRVVCSPIMGFPDEIRTVNSDTLELAEFHLNAANEFDIEMGKLGIETNINPHIEQLVGGEWYEISSCKELKGSKAEWINKPMRILIPS